MIKTEIKNNRIQTFIRYIEHISGKEVLSCEEMVHKDQRMCIFTDKTCSYFDPGMIINKNTIVFCPLPESICACCGKEAHITEWNDKGQCSVYIKKFWEKARKLYWHRYSQNKK